jgi:ribonuclease Y
MLSQIHPLLGGALVLLGGIGIGYAFFRWRDQAARRANRVQEDAAREAARREADTLLREARLKANEEALRLREEADQSFSARRKELLDLEGRLAERESLVNRQLENLVTDERNLRAEKQALADRATELDRQLAVAEHLRVERLAKLQEITRMGEAEARAQFLREVAQSAEKDAADITRKTVETARALAEDKARHIVSIAIQRYAADHTFETTTATISLTDPDMKGRIIGREGRNIRSFEAVTGVTVLIDDTPNAVVLSGFDPVRREIAREAMQRLILDGRIHPTRIEEVVAKVSQEIDETILRLGQDAVTKAGQAPMSEEVTRLLGRLHFRLSYSQNILDHSVEVAHLTGLIAGELGLDVPTAKRAGLLHDLGKAVSHEVEGPHALVGADILKRNGESPVIVNAVASHHDEVAHEGPLGIIVSAADAISGARPGARTETMTTYLKRLQDLERIATAREGVEKAYAISAGREVRVFVHPDQLTDDQAQNLARSLVRDIEEQLQYPGQIRVTVIRETRVVEFAK